MRALSAGVSGLRNHLIELDVIGNNIANVDTVAFKASRVTFKEAFAQLLAGAERPPGDQGGINPIQVGLGVTVGSIDQDFSQGNLQTTSQQTDLAIQGDAFFAVGNGTQTYYTRAGNFQTDADGRLVAPNNGFVVQGRMADQNGVIPSNAAIQGIILPFGQKSPAKATTSVSLSGNLDSRQVPSGTILETTGMLLATEQATSNGGAGSDVNGLYASGSANGQILGMTPNSTTVTISNGATSETYTYVTTDTGVGDKAFHSIKDLVAEINNDFGANSAAQNANGSISFTNQTAGAVALTVTSTNSTLEEALSALNGNLAAAASNTSDQFSHIATGSDLLVDLRNGSGASLGLTAGQSVLVDGNKGGTAVTQGTLTVTATSRYSDLMSTVRTTLGIVNQSAAVANASSGALTINGDGGTANALSGVNVRVAAGAANFNAIFDSQPGNYSLIQSATDVTQTASIGVYDSMGNAHTVSVTFTKDPTQPNRWTWAATVLQPATVTGGDTGAVTFDSNGQLESFTYDNGSTSFQFDPNTGASAPVDIRFNAGTLGKIDGLAQFASASTAVASGQDGYAMGNLQDISIDKEGVITGSFTNGVNQKLAQIALASFNNPTGLLRQGDNMYATSGNSGQAVMGYAGSSNQSSITAGALEGSNVDLGQEFTDMIVAQRGFEANAKIITTSDEMLSDLVNLKRS
jgi:flagellar hook protein FlgE